MCLKAINIQTCERITNQSEGNSRRIIIIIIIIIIFIYLIFTLGSIDPEGKKQSWKQGLEWLALAVWYVSKGPPKSNFVKTLN